MLIAIVIAKKIFDIKIHRIHRIPNGFMSKWNSTIWAIWLGDWLSSTFGIWDLILGIEGSWTSKFEGPLWALCSGHCGHSGHCGPSNLEVQLPSMPKIEAQIPKVELTPHLASITQPNSSNCTVSFWNIYWVFYESYESLCQRSF